MKVEKIEETEAPLKCSHDECIHNRNEKCSLSTIRLAHTRVDGELKKICLNFATITAVA